MNHSNALNQQTRPKFVQWGLILLYSTLVIGVVRSAIEFSGASQKAAALGGASFVIYITLFTLSILAGIIYFISRRKRWALYLFSILFIFGLPYSIQPLLNSLRDFPVSGLLGVMQLLGQAAGVVFLWLRPSREWFAKKIS